MWTDLYMKRAEGGRGIISIEEFVNVEINSCKISGMDAESCVQAQRRSGAKCFAICFFISTLQGIVVTRL